MTNFKLTSSAALALALTVSACGGAPEADADGDGTITQAEAEEAMAASDITITPGEWENTVEFVEIEFDESQLPPEARGMVGPMLEAMRGQKNTTKSCVTEEQAEKPAAEMFSGGEDNDCEYDKFEFSGGNIDMAMTCSDPNAGEAKITNVGTFTDSSYAMEMDIVMEGSEMGPMTIKAKSEGKRVGDCAE